MGMVYVRDRSKPKKKLSAKDRALAASWDELMKKYPPLKSTRKVVEKKVQAKPTELLKAKYDTTVATKAAPKVYTGDKMIGIGVMHKSSLVPIFNDQAAKDLASMRR
jgi:hypothetical protein